MQLGEVGIGRAERRSTELRLERVVKLNGTHARVNESFGKLGTRVRGVRVIGDIHASLR